MEQTQIKWKSLLNKLKELKQFDEKEDALLKAYWTHVNPEIYAPWTNFNRLSGFLEALKLFLPFECFDWIEYYLYEVDAMKEKAVKVVDENDRKYNFKQFSDVVKFFETNYGKEVICQTTEK